MEDETVVYMCKTDYVYELGMAVGGTKIYASEEDLRANRKCVERCGIVKVSVKFVDVVQEENYGRK